MVDGFDTSVIVAHDGGGTTLAGRTSRACSAMRWRCTASWPGRQQAAILLGGKYTLRSGISAIAEFYTPPNTAYYLPSGCRHRWAASTTASCASARRGFVNCRGGRNGTSRVPDFQFDDGSRIGVFDVGRRCRNRFYAYLHAQTPGGKPGRSEFGAIPYSALVSIGVTFQM